MLAPSSLVFPTKADDVPRPGLCSVERFNLPSTFRMIAAGLLLIGAFSLVLGRPTVHDSDHLRLHDRRSDVPAGFKYVGKAVPSAMLDLRIALTQRDSDGLIAALYDVSTPGSANYRKHLTKAQVDAFVAPKPESIQAVTAWLSRNNITAQTASPTSSWVNIRIPVAQANTLLDTQFDEYVHEETNTTALRTLSYSVPASVQDHLQFVHPATSFVPPRLAPTQLDILPRQPQSDVRRHRAETRSRRASIASGSSSSRVLVTSKSRPTSTTALRPTPTAKPDDSCKTSITPKCLQAIYNIPITPASNEENNLFVASFIGESADPADLKRFLGKFRPDVRNDTAFAVQSIDAGTNNLVSATLEASLDIQYTVGLATNVNTTFASVGTNFTDGIAGFLDIINVLIAQEEVPLVLTTSFAFNEKDIPVALAKTMCNAYAQLGARGTTILFGSGDGGVSGVQQGECTTFQPTFPSSCPFVTSVGGTTGFGPEVAASLSGGGFSNTFERPAYQDNAVKTYLKKLGKTNAGLFNASGRAIPDIAAQAQRFQVFRGGKLVSVSGTSAASPTVAGIVALLNDAILNDGGRLLGFLNPFLYQKGAAALNDITQGHNPGCGTDGFPATEGWDAVTGLGTPDFAKLLRMAIGKNITQA